MKALAEFPLTWEVKPWARFLALLVLVALCVVALGVMHAWLTSGHFPVSFPGVLPTLVFGYVSLAIGWVGIFGKVPKFFPIGTLRWPFFRPRA